jgi:hypothetical protein
MNMNFLFSLPICISLDKCNRVMNIHIYVCLAMDAVTNMQKKYDKRYFILWTFHWNIATFQQCLPIECIYFILFDIPKLVFPIRIYLKEGCCYQWSCRTRGLCWISWSHHLENLGSSPSAGQPLRNICLTNDHGYFPLVV